jgi:hypothetical protein
MYYGLEDSDSNEVREVELILCDVYSFASQIWNVVSKYRQMNKLEIV